MGIVGALDLHRKQVTFDWVDTESGENRRGRLTPATRETRWGQRRPLAAVSAPSCPEVMRVPAGPEAGCIGHGHRLAEAVRKGGRLMRVAPERDRLPAFLVPPSDDLRVDLPSRVDLQRPIAVSKHAQRVTKFVPERFRIERPSGCWPVTDGVVDVGQHGERVGAADQSGYFGQVLPDDIGGRSPRVQVGHLAEPLLEGQAVLGTEHSVELTGLQQARGDDRCASAVHRVRRR